MINIAILNLWPTPYKDPIYREFHDAQQEYNLTVYYLNSIDKGHSYQTVVQGQYNTVKMGKENNLDYKTLAFWRSKKDFTNYFLAQFCEREVRCVIVPGHGSSFCLGALSAANKLGIPYVYAADTICNDTGSVLRKLLRRILTSRYLKRAGSVWVPGLASRQYMRQYGVPNHEIFEGMYCLDIDRLAAVAEEHQKQRQELRKRYGFGESETVFLFAGRFLKVCNFDVMLKGFFKAAADNPNLRLELVGGGEEQRNISRLLEEQGIHNVHIRDFIPIEEIVSLYVAADIYYMTYDWAHYSLACIQAAICRKPVITTETLGAAFDCIEHKKNGYIIPPRNEDAAAEAILKMAALSAEEIKQMGEYSFEKVKNRTLGWAAQQMKGAVDRAIAKGGRGK